MDGVRAVARLSGVVAWITLLIGVVGVVVLVLQLDKMLRSDVGVAMVISLLVILLLSAMGPFSVWAGLTALCEIHERQIELLDLQRAGSAAGRSGPDTGSGDGPQHGEEDEGPPVELELVTGYPYAVGERITVVKETMLHEGKQRPERAVKYVPANTAAKVLSVYEGWVRVKTVHGDVGFVGAEAVTPGAV